MDDHDRLIALLNRLKLTALRDQLDSLIDEAGRRDLTIREALTMFCEREVARRDQRRIDMSFGLARFPFVRDLTSFDFGAQPSLDKAQIREIATGRFIANGEAVLLLGPPGVRQDASGRGPGPRSDCRWSYGAVHAGDDTRRTTGQSSFRRAARRAADVLRQAQAANRRRTRLPSFRT